MEQQKVVAKPSSEFETNSSQDLFKYALYLFIGLVVLGIAVYFYMWKVANDVKRDIDRFQNIPLEVEAETDEQIETKIQEIQKYLLQHPPE